MKATFVALAAMVPSALAHGYVTEPPTRGEIKFGTSNERGFPIGMKDTCTSLPPRDPTTISAGDLTIKMQFNDGANHVGMCTAFIANSDGSNRQKIGEMKDCARSLHPGPGNKGDGPIPAEMTATIPASGCGSENCMLFWTLSATHISESNPEIYDDCMDVKVQGFSSGGGKNEQQQPEATQKPEATATTTSHPAKQTDSNSGSGSESGSGSGSSDNGGCSKVWEQCGGKEWKGPKCCGDGLQCEYQNDWYSQCISN
ncbi:hypothetical protein HK104_007823 [Borealophlyctis nickersoniae]|nr:hypothetical protein HK104_007823 [Borealophlyctis nickersoniae]